MNRGPGQPTWCYPTLTILLASLNMAGEHGPPLVLVIGRTMSSATGFQKSDCSKKTDRVDQYWRASGPGNYSLDELGLICSRKVIPRSSFWTGELLPCCKMTQAHLSSSCMGTAHMWLFISHEIFTFTNVWLEEPFQAVQIKLRVGTTDSMKQKEAKIHWSFIYWQSNQHVH